MLDHAFALLIGIDENKLSGLALPIVAKDINRLHSVLTHPDRCGYPEGNVVALGGADATSDRILKALDSLQAKLETDADPNQTVFIYYSGHGHCEPSGEAYLIPYDARFPIRAGGLAARDFADSIEAIRPRRLLVVLDCCHAEAMQAKEAKETGLKSAALTPETPGVSLLMQGESRAVLSSSRGDQQSWVRSDGQMSVFTYHLVEALTGFAGRPSWPTVNVTEVMDYVGRTVPVTARTQHGATQEPTFRYSGTAFPVSLVLGGKGLHQDVPAPDPLAALAPKAYAEGDFGTVRDEVVVQDIEEVVGGEAHSKGHAEVVERGRFTVQKIKVLK